MLQEALEALCEALSKLRNCGVGISNCLVLRLHSAIVVGSIDSPVR